VNFALSDDQLLLRDTARQLLADRCPPTLLRAHMDDLGAADALWGSIADFVGLGVGPTVDLCVFMEELGYVAAPVPFLATACLYAPVLDAIGEHDLDAVLDGHATGTVALAGADGIWHPNAEHTKTFVPDAATVDLIAAVDADGAVTLLASPPARRIDTLDTTRALYDVETAVPGTSAGIIDRAALDAVIARATVALAAEMVGTARRLFDMTLAYAKERVQFDVPIGSFQAIQHKLADVSLDVERAWSAVYQAAMAIDADDHDRHRAVHVAKAAAGQAATRAAKDGIQIHGGIGFTWEHDLHLFIRRAYGAEALLGPTGWHHDRLADLLI
jgi:alkylation response protein AidB-like acyl-CoA dehydrogenase